MLLVDDHPDRPPDLESMLRSDEFWSRSGTLRDETVSPRECALDEASFGRGRHLQQAAQGDGGCFFGNQAATLVQKSTKVGICCYIFLTSADHHLLFSSSFPVSGLIRPSAGRWKMPSDRYQI